MNPNENNLNDMEIHWTTTLSWKWQVVIPKDVRNLLNLKEWDKLTVITKKWIAIWLIKSDNFEQMLKYMQEECNSMKK